MELWGERDFVRGVLQRAIESYQELTPFSVRESAFESWKECTQFKPSLAVDIIRFFHARRMLDFSAGWGDRLAGAIAAGIEHYRAYDPNTALTAGHSALIDRYVPDNLRTGEPAFLITYTGFEHARLKDDDFDLVFTSPPFFDFEIYTSAPGQSVDTYHRLSEWLVHFLLGCLRKAWAALRVGGHCVIHITDVYKTKVCEAMCLLSLGHLPGCVYLGVLNSVGAADKPRPLWAFRKDARSPDTDRVAQAAKADLKKLHPDIFILAETQQSQQSNQGAKGQPSGVSVSAVSAFHGNENNIGPFSSLTFLFFLLVTQADLRPDHKCCSRWDCGIWMRWRRWRPTGML